MEKGNIIYGIKTFSDSNAVLLDLSPMELPWWAKIIQAVLFILLLAFIAFAIFFYILFPAQLVQLLPMLLIVLILMR